MSMTLPAGYRIDQFGLMVESEPRMSTYAQALKNAVTPGCRVIDIGAGFGIFSMLACKYGAGEVIAIEPDPAVELLMPMARANGCADRITVVRDISTNYTPSEKADVLISDIRGITPLFQQHIPTIIDARERLLKPGGHQLPVRDFLRIAPVHAPDLYRACHRPWLENDYDLDLSEGHRFATNISVAIKLDAEALMAEPQDLAVLEYRTITDTNVDSRVEFSIERRQPVHGVLVWFDAEIAEGPRFSNAPGERKQVYFQKFLPFEKPVAMREGETCAVRVRARLLENDYVWSWDTDITGRGEESPRESFRQSTFRGRVVSPQRIRPFAHDEAPSVTQEMAIDRDCLSMVGDGRSFAEIADALLDEYPARFAGRQAALDYATALIARYSG